MHTRVATRFLWALREVNLETWLKKYFTRHSALRKYSRVRITKIDHPGAGSHPEARYTSKGIELYPKFWELPSVVQDFVLTHEFGHHVESEAGLSNLIESAEALGINPWETSTLPFGQHNMEEAFADSFASYHTDGDVKHRYPLWTALVETLSR